MLNIAEIFASIQGETTYAGLPFVFARLSGCNLSCSFCDSKHAHDPASGSKVSVDGVLSQVEAFGIPRLCVTGGEPLLQPEALALVSAACDRGWLVTVETNGSLPVSGLDSRAIRIMDVKCPGSDEATSLLVDNFDALRDTDQVKFVVASQADYDYAKTMIVDRRAKGAKWEALLSPVFGAVEPVDLAGWVVADALDARFQLQLHKVVWGPERTGV